MKALQTLIKLNKNTLDKILIDINKSEQEKAIILNRLKNLNDEITSETSLYKGSEFSFMLEQYLDNAYKKQARIQAQIDKLSCYIDQRRIVLADQYSELKKYEIALETKQKELYLKALREETKMLDEFGSKNYMLS